MSDYKEYIVRVYPTRTEWGNKEGELHREGGPAIYFTNFCNEYWYKNGAKHREDGPAVIEQNGDKIWYKEGKIHREDGPAIERLNGMWKEWCQNGQYHREDGPAIEEGLKRKRWFIHGKEFTQQEFLNRNKKEFSMDEIAKALGVPVGELKIKKD